jgi:hypothetical protein
VSKKRKKSSKLSAGWGWHRERYPSFVKTHVDPSVFKEEVSIVTDIPCESRHKQNVGIVGRTVETRCVDTIPVCDDLGRVVLTARCRDGKHAKKFRRDAAGKIAEYMAMDEIVPNLVLSE